MYIFQHLLLFFIYIFIFMTLNRYYIFVRIKINSKTFQSNFQILQYGAAFIPANAKCFGIGLLELQDERSPAQAFCRTSQGIVLG